MENHQCQEYDGYLHIAAYCLYVKVIQGPLLVTWVTPHGFESQPSRILDHHN
jgi:hypothetical protein